MEDKEVDDFLKFVNIANDVCKEKGKSYEFICPECNGKAIAIRDEFNYFMSNFVMDTQWGIGAMQVVASPQIKIDDNFKEIKDDKMF